MTETIKKHARVDVADVLRGFAVLAIILLHSIEHFNFYSFPPTDGQPAWLNFTDKAIWNGLFLHLVERLTPYLRCSSVSASLYSTTISACVAMTFVCVSAGVCCFCL